MSEDRCRQCGLPIGECNARAMQRMECEAIVKALAKESDEQMRLRAGELTAGEIRAARSFLLLAHRAISRPHTISPPIENYSRD